MHRDLSNIVYSMTIRGWKMKLFSLLTFSLFLLLGCQSQMSESDVQNMILENNEFINTTLTEHHSDLSIRISDIENQINLLNLYNSSQPNVGYDLEGDIYYLEDEIYGLEDKIYELEDEIKIISSKLDNKQFIAKAPAEVIHKEKKKIEDVENKKKMLEKSILNLQI